jgi:hypothetical protein
VVPTVASQSALTPCYERAETDVAFPSLSSESICFGCCLDQIDRSLGSSLWTEARGATTQQNNQPQAA